MTVLKGQSLERGNKRVRLELASEACVFVVEPAFKTYSSGDQVSSGDLSCTRVSRASSRQTRLSLMLPVHELSQVTK